MGRRTRGRKFLLQCRYASDANGRSLELNFESMSIDSRIDDPEVRQWIRDLGRVTVENLPEINSRIESVLRNWSFDRLTPITRLILQQAVAENLYMDIPAAVAITEAVRLGQEFEGPDTGSFLNGILDRMLFREGEGSAYNGERPQQED